MECRIKWDKASVPPARTDSGMHESLVRHFLKRWRHHSGRYVFHSSSCTKVKETELPMMKTSTKMLRSFKNNVN